MRKFIYDGNNLNDLKEKKNKVRVLTLMTKNIPEYAFKEFKNLKKVIITDVVLSIGIGAFIGCEKLQTVKILPREKFNRINLDAGAFFRCPNLTRINMEYVSTRLNPKSIFSNRKLEGLLSF